MKLVARNFWKITTFILLCLLAALSVYIWKINDNVFRVNSNGQTYNVGAVDYSNPMIVPPDLELAIGKNGNEGYLIREEFERICELPPDDPELIALEGDSPGLYEIPLYKSDGVTQIDVFVLG